ncbi:hypothetical protein J6590_066440 [Homalodisca vitripennis]|nr:hypothetical protein J6590_066440 [Homalodisca vitripennis]
MSPISQRPNRLISQRPATGALRHPAARCGTSRGTAPFITSRSRDHPYHMPYSPPPPALLTIKCAVGLPHYGPENRVTRNLVTPLALVRGLGVGQPPLCGFRSGSCDRNTCHTEVEREDDAGNLTTRGRIFLCICVEEQFYKCESQRPEQGLDNRWVFKVTMKIFSSAAHSLGAFVQLFIGVILLIVLAAQEITHPMPWKMWAFELPSLWSLRGSGSKQSKFRGAALAANLGTKLNNPPDLSRPRTNDLSRVYLIQSKLVNTFEK